MEEEALISFAFETHISATRLTHNNWRHKLGHTQNIE